MKKKAFIGMISLLSFLVPLVFFAQEEEPLVEVKRLQDLMEKTVTPVEEEKEAAQTSEEPEKKEAQSEVKTQPEIQEIPFQKKNRLKLSSGDFLLEKKGAFHSLWIRADRFQSAALINAQGKTRYFLRAPFVIPQQKENSVSYEKKKIGNESRLYFLASSQIQDHPVLGKAFEIVIPEQMVYGYGKNKTGQSISLKPGQTELRVRVYEKKYAQGKFQEVLYRVHPVPSVVKSASRIQLVQSQPVQGKKAYTLLYTDSKPEIKEIFLKSSDAKRNLFLPLQGEGEGFQILFLSYHQEKQLFFMLFQLTLKEGDTETLSVDNGESVSEIELN